MGNFAKNVLMLVVIVIVTISSGVNSQRNNPTILQDSRDLPTPEGYFGFLYRTEDGISHAARGDPNGQVHGRFTYTDPTGLKVNFNYNAGSKAKPGYNSNDASSNPQPSRASAVETPQYQQPIAPKQRPLLVAAQASRGPNRVSNTVNDNYYYDPARNQQGRQEEYYQDTQQNVPVGKGANQNYY